jgi:hypothetical protein
MANELELPTGIRPVNPVPVDSWSGPYSGADKASAVSAALAAIPLAARFKTMDVRLLINGIGKKYWFKNGITDADFVEVKPDQFVYGEEFGMTGANPAGDIAILGSLIAQGYKYIKLPAGSFAGFSLDVDDVTIEGIKPRWNGVAVLDGTIFTGRVSVTGNRNRLINSGSTAVGAGNNDGILIRNNASFNYVENWVFNVGNHAVLVEQYGGTATDNYIRNCNAYGGVHGFVSKSANLTFENCISKGSSQDALVFVSDNITWDSANPGVNKNSICKNNKAINCYGLNSNIGFNFYSRDYSSTTNAAGIELTDVAIIGGGSDTMIAYGAAIGDSVASAPAGQTYNDVKNISFTGGWRETGSATFGVKTGRCFSVSIDRSCIVNSASDQSKTLSKRVRMSELVKQGGNIGNLVYDTVLDVNSATPTVYYGDQFFTTANTASTVITNFLNGKIGQVIHVLINDEFTTIIGGGNILLKNYVRGTGATISLKMNQSFVWVELYSKPVRINQDWPYTPVMTLSYTNAELMFCYITGNVTSINFTNLVKGTTFALIVQANGTWDIGAWDARILWQGGYVPKVIGSASTRYYEFFFDGTNIHNISRQGEIFRNSVGFNPGVIAPGARVTTTVAVSGAPMNSFVNMSFQQDLQGVQMFSYISAVGIATVVFINGTSGTVNLATGTLIVEARAN